MQFEFVSCPASWALMGGVFIDRARIPPTGVGIFDGPKLNWTSHPREAAFSGKA